MGGSNLRTSLEMREVDIPPQLLLTVVLVVASAAPQEPPVAIVLDDRSPPENGAYSFQFQAENGIRQSEAGSPGLEGQTNVQGVFSFPLDDGSVAEVRYQADENGFQVQSPLLPVAPEFPHPIPQFVLDQIAFAEEQDRLEAQGQLLQ
ncbi:cuticle protein AM/CP1114-like [Penaeus japonicus]|uniref:cuticle protein AM/CP1114-like n=1 Tax=Penaeus japonicus TaxID=27405 RepID=UPI001C71545D|nr:cuticle protein AM/CP1114-like [Penaeus japonicus]